MFLAVDRTWPLGTFFVFFLRHCQSQVKSITFPTLDKLKIGFSRLRMFFVFLIQPPKAVPFENMKFSRHDHHDWTPQKKSLKRHD